MDEPRYLIKGRIYAAIDDALQDALQSIYDTPERPHCLCVPAGVEMYIAKHRQFVIKRLPDTGNHHHPGCPSYEPDAAQSGLGELIGEAVIERTPDAIELRVDFALTRTLGHAVSRGDSQEVGEVKAIRRRMSLRAFMHYLFERAGLNRWVPAMEGKRNQGVLCKYLLEAAADLTMKGVRLAERLYVPEPFSESNRNQAAERRRAKLAFLQAPSEQSHYNMALILGEFKSSECTATGRKIWIKHLPDFPLLMDAKTWQRIERIYGALFEARDADMAHRPKIVMCALVFAKREHTYQIDTAGLMLTNEQWIPVEGLYELDLLQQLIAQKRRFLKPLRYDAKQGAAFPNALLLDTGEKATPLHVLSNFLDKKELTIKTEAIKRAGPSVWVWETKAAIPEFPGRLLQLGLRP